MHQRDAHTLWTEAYFLHSLSPSSSLSVPLDQSKLRSHAKSVSSHPACTSCKILFSSRQKGRKTFLGYRSRTGSWFVQMIQSDFSWEGLWIDRRKQSTSVAYLPWVASRNEPPTRLYWTLYRGQIEASCIHARTKAFNSLQNKICTDTWPLLQRKRQKYAKMRRERNKILPIARITTALSKIIVPQAIKHRVALGRSFVIQFCNAGGHN